MTVTLGRSVISGTVKAPPSKSHAHRLLIAAFLRGTPCTVHGIGRSDDMVATLQALKALGGEFECSGDSVRFIRRTSVEFAEVDCKESGSTLRFLLPVACALGIRTAFRGSSRLFERPISALKTCLNAHGGDVRIDDCVYGSLKPGKYVIDASQSSQFVSGLLFALSVLNGKSELTVKGKIVSKGYINLTVDVLRAFGAYVMPKGRNGYIIRGGFEGGGNEFTAEGDWSNAAFLLSAGALCGSINVDGLDRRSYQGDKQIIKILREYGAKVTCRGDRVTVCAGERRALNVDIEQIPDLAQIISVLAAYADGDSTLKNTLRLALKESDRVAAIENMLAAAGVECERSDSGAELTIHGGAPKSAHFSGGSDHRTVMSTAVLALAANGRSDISGAGAVNKSYPKFFTDIRSVGGDVSVDI